MNLLSWLKDKVSKKDHKIHNPEVKQLSPSEKIKIRLNELLQKNIKKAQQENIKCFRCKAISGLNHITLYRVRDGKDKRRYICNNCLNSKS